MIVSISVKSVVTFFCLLVDEVSEGRLLVAVLLLGDDVEPLHAGAPRAVPRQPRRHRDLPLRHPAAAATRALLLRCELILRAITR